MVFNYLSMPIYGIIAGLIASIFLGPIGVLCIQRTLNKNRRAGFISGLAAAVADAFFAALAIFALSWIESFITNYGMWFQILGGLLIMLFGFMTFFKKPQRPQPVKSGSNKGSDLSNFFSVLFLTLPNPGYFFIFVAIFSAMGLGGIEYSSLQNWLMIVGVLLGASAWWFGFTLAVDRFRHKFTLRSLLWLNKISGGIIFIIGSYAVLTVVYELVQRLVEVEGSVFL